MKTKTQGKTVTTISSITLERFNMNTFFKNIIKYQDLNYWKENPEQFNIWVRKRLQLRIENLEFIIEG